MYKQLFSYEDIFQRCETSFSKNTYVFATCMKLSAGGKGQFPTYKRLTNGLPCSHQPSDLPFPIKEPSNMVKKELTYIIKNKEMIKFEEK